MKLYWILPIILLCYKCCGSDNSNKNLIDQKVDDAIQKYLQNPTFNDDPIDPKVLEELKDSGNIVNGLRQGIWKEYRLDSTLYGKKDTIMKNGKKTVHESKTVIIERSRGKYINNIKEGTWVTYQSFDTKEPLTWVKSLTCNYKNDLKDSTEIFYTAGTIMAAVYNYKEGKLSGICKEYNINYPFHLQRIYLAIDGKLHIKEEYYNDGRIKNTYRDTILGAVQHIFFKSFDSTGCLKESGYILDRDTLAYDGVYTTYYRNGYIESTTNYILDKVNGEKKYFFDNGQLWTTLIFKNGLVWQVLNNYDIHGNKMDMGTLKEGNGSLILYNKEGKEYDVEYYKDGVYLNDDKKNKDQK